MPSDDFTGTNETSLIVTDPTNDSITLTVQGNGAAAQLGSFRIVTGNLAAASRGDQPSVTITRI